MRKRGHIPVLAAAMTLGLATPAVASLDQCGDYKITGLLTCNSAKCSVIVYPESRSETEIQLKEAPKVYVGYDHATVQFRIRLVRIEQNGARSLVARVLDPVPLRALPNPSASAVQLEKKASCHS